MFYFSLHLFWNNTYNVNLVLFLQLFWFSPLSFPIFLFPFLPFSSLSYSPISYPFVCSTSKKQRNTKTIATMMKFNTDCYMIEARNLHSKLSQTTFHKVENKHELSRKLTLHTRQRAKEVAKRFNRSITISLGSLLAISTESFPTESSELKPLTRNGWSQACRRRKSIKRIFA